MKIYNKLILLILLSIILAGCGPSEEQQIATLTQVAAEIFATQTAEYTPPPTATHTPTKIPTATPLPTLTPTPLPDAVVLDLIDMWEGPGWRFNFIDNLYEGDEPRVIGQKNNCSYLWVEDIKGQYGWIENYSLNIQLNLPCEQIPLGIFQPQNGDRVSRIPMMLDDVGELKISNGTGSDIVLILRDEIGNVWGHYIHAGETYTIDHISDGTYNIYFSTGSQWNGEAFTKDVSYQKFDESISFKTTSNQYTIWEITLHPVAGGQATTSGVDQEDFPSLVGGD